MGDLGTNGSFASRGVRIPYFRERTRGNCELVCRLFLNPTDSQLGLQQTSLTVNRLSL
jgi:hypothetical protein